MNTKSQSFSKGKQSFWLRSVGNDNLYNLAYLKWSVLQKGVFLLVLSLLFFMSSDLLLKQLVLHYHTVQTTFLRAVMRVLPLLLFLSIHSDRNKLLKTSRLREHLFRCVISAISTYCFMLAFSLSPLSHAYALGYSSAIFFTLLGVYILKAPIDKQRWFAVILGLIGILIALRPHDVIHIGSLVILGGSFFAALNKILVKQLSTTENTLTIAIYSNLFLTFLLAPFLLFYWREVSMTDWGWFLAAGILSSAAQYAMFQAIRYLPVSILASFDYTSFVWMTVLEYIFWQIIPNAYVIGGTLIIIVSNIYIIQREKRVSERKETLPISQVPAVT